MQQRGFIKFLSETNATGPKNASFQKNKAKHSPRNSVFHSLKLLPNPTSTSKKHSSPLPGTPYSSPSCQSGKRRNSSSREIKKQMIDSATTNSGANANVSLDNKGQGKLGGGCCS